MIKFIILFQQPTDLDGFEDVYADFLALVERMPNITRRQVAHVTGSPQGAPPFYRILEIYFESPRHQQEALMSKIGQEAGQELGRLPRGAVQLLFADVYEEAGGATPPTAPKTLRFADLSLDTDTHRAWRRERAIHLTPKEYELLLLFMQNPRQILSREVIFERVWGGDDDGKANVIRVYMRYLRQKTEAEQESRLIHTVRGSGYILREA